MTKVSSRIYRNCLYWFLENMLICLVLKFGGVDLHSVLELGSVDLDSVLGFCNFAHWTEPNRDRLQKCRSGHSIVFRSPFTLVVGLFAFDPRPSYPSPHTSFFSFPSIFSIHSHKKGENSNFLTSKVTHSSLQYTKSPPRFLPFLLSHSVCYHLELRVWTTNRHTPFIVATPRATEGKNRGIGFFFGSYVFFTLFQNIFGVDLPKKIPSLFTLAW